MAFLPFSESDLIGMWLRDAAYKVGPYGYVIRVVKKDGVPQPLQYQPNYSYERWRLNVSVRCNRISEVFCPG